jgi:hypothetical protein
MSAESKRKIRELMVASKIGDQGLFAKALGVAQSLVSACLAGKEPSVAMYQKLGIFASENRLYSEAIWFWSRAGQPISAILPVAEHVLKQQRRVARPDEMALIQPLREAGETGDTLSFTISLIRNPGSTRYVRARDDFQQLRRGDVLLIDESEINADALTGACVAIYRSPDQETFSEAYFKLRRGIAEGASAKDLETLVEYGQTPFEHMGVYAGWLREREDAFFVDAPSRLGVLMSRMIAHRAANKIFVNGDLKILGRVVAWIENIDGRDGNVQGSVGTHFGDFDKHRRARKVKG